MLSPILLTAALALISAPSAVEGRYRWMERDDRAVLLHPRRFGQEHPAVIEKLSSACDGAVCGNLAGQAITPLLAAQGECTQQDMADAIIDASRQFDDATQQNMIALAQEYRQAEKNTPPDFSTNPPANRNSVFCQKAPKNAELNGLVQAQDPANDPELFFDPETKSTIKLGSQANTQAFGGDASSSASSGSSASGSSSNASASSNSASATATSSAAEASASVDTGAVAAAASDSGNSTASASGDIGDFGSCSVPQIEFGVGFDNRKESSFRPVDTASYNHESAQNMDIISDFMCDTLTNSCGADDTAKATCQSAIDASKQAQAKTGAQADAFNAVFGVTTSFASEDAIDNQGKVVSAGTGSSGSASSSASADSSSSSASSGSAKAASLDTSASSADSSSSTATATDSASSSSSSSSSSASSGSTSTGDADFGSCSTPEIEFGQGFDNRKETSFQPADKTSFDHGSAQAIGIIAQFICDTLTNKCQANQAAKDLCTQAQTAANGGTPKTGGQADAFNAVFGTTTNFADVTAIDDQGKEIGAAASANAQVATGNTASSGASAASSSSSTASAAQSTSSAASSSSGSSAGNLQTFTGALGGVAAPTVSASGDGKFQVEGNSAFNSEKSAIIRSCDVQHNKCANAANSSGNQGDVTVEACGQQQSDCIAQAGGQ